jgi:hypothetical protein
MNWYHFRAQSPPPPGVDGETWLYNSNGSWGSEAENYLWDSNVMALIQTMASPLLGSFSISQFGYRGPRRGAD